MKKVITKIIQISTFGLLVLPTITVAQVLELTQEAAGQAGFNTANVDETSLASVIGLVARTFLSLLGVLFIAYTIYGGWLWLSAAGNDEKITKAKKTIRDGIIGLVITLSAAGIYLFVKTALLGDSGASPFSSASG